MESASPSSALPQPTRQRAAGIVSLVFAALVGGCGLCATTLYLANPVMARSTLETNVLFGGLAGLGWLFALGLGWQGIAILRGRTSAFIAHIIPPVWVWLGMFFIAVILGIAILSFGETAALPVVYAFPILHVTAAIAPSLALIAYTARHLGKDARARPAFFNLVWGAFGATTVALVGELVVGILILLIAAIALVSLPDSETQIENLRRALEIASRADDFSALLPWLANPLVIGGGLFYFALLVPILEELFKTLALAFMNPRTTRARDAVLWGVCAGAGFALVENVFNAGSMLSAWGVVILMRAGTAMMHIANGAWLGRGWHAARVERRWGRLVQMYVLCVVVHAIWNGAAIGMTVSAFALGGSAATLPASGFVGAMASVLVILTALALISVVVMVRRVTRESMV